jgi:hypothetical protein
MTKLSKQAEEKMSSPAFKWSSTLFLAAILFFTIRNPDSNMAFEWLGLA